MDQDFGQSSHPRKEAILPQGGSVCFDITSPFDAARKLAPSVLVHSIARVSFEAR